MKKWIKKLLGSYVTTREINIKFNCKIDEQEFSRVTEKLKNLQVTIDRHRPVDELIRVCENTISEPLSLKYSECSGWSVEIDGTRFKESANTLRAAIEELLASVIKAGMNQ